MNIICLWLATCRIVSVLIQELFKGKAISRNNHIIKCCSWTGNALFRFEFFKRYLKLFLNFTVSCVIISSRSTLSLFFAEHTSFFQRGRITSAISVLCCRWERNWTGWANLRTVCSKHFLAVIIHLEHLVILKMKWFSGFNPC